MTNIGSAVRIIGDVECSEDDLLVEGHIRGEIRVHDISLEIAPRARVEGDIRCSRVLVHGEVHGSIWASERVELSETAIVLGAVNASRVLMADGAIVNGRVDMEQRSSAATVAPAATDGTDATA